MTTSCRASNRPQMHSVACNLSAVFKFAKILEKVATVYGCAVKDEVHTYVQPARARDSGTLCWRCLRAEVPYE
jgi:hypothetical protein